MSNKLLVSANKIKTTNIINTIVNNSNIFLHLGSGDKGTFQVNIEKKRIIDDNKETDKKPMNYCDILSDDKYFI